MESKKENEEIMKRDEVEAYYIAHYKSLMLFALSLTKNIDDAEDLVSSAFVKAMLSFEKGNFKAWIYKVLQNEFYNMYRRRKKFTSDEAYDVEWIEAPENILQQFIEREEQRWLYSKLLKLPDRERKIMLLSVVRELSDQDVADIVGISVANVRVIKHRVKQKLIEESKNYG